MLISFAATNHRSLRERCELSLVAERNPVAGRRTTLGVPGFDLEVLPVAALMGANGSGKSNVLDALWYVVSAVAASQIRWPVDARPPRASFMTLQGPSDDPSVYEMTFAVNDVVYEYEFRVGPTSIEYERLLMAPNGARSRTLLFERTHGQQGKVRIAFGRRLKGPRLAAESATRANSLFLSSAAQNNHQMLTPVWRWIVRQCRVATPRDREPRAVYTARQLSESDAAYREQLRRFLASADLGIEDVHVDEVEISEDQLRQLWQVLSMLGIEEAPDGRDVVNVRTRFRHRGDVGTIDLSDESAGTQAWFEWAAPVVDAINAGQVLGADELDAHLNEHLAARIVTAFQDPETNPRGAQLIFTSQDPHVVTLVGLARDQVWITEKSSRGATSLIPVTDFRPRKDWEIGRAYRYGRFGGLPVVDEDEFTGALTAAGRS